MELKCLPTLYSFLPSQNTCTNYDDMVIETYLKTVEPI